ncbi:MAG: DUF1993 domain-containing protein [Polyangiaceae bacterium]
MQAFDVSVATFTRGLKKLKGILDKAQQFAASAAIDEGALLTARLAEDMYDLSAQVFWAAEGARLAMQRLLGSVPAPPAAPQVKSFSELVKGIDSALAYLEALEPAAVEASLERTIVLEYPGVERSFSGATFLCEFAIPNFFFHYAQAYAILRNRGVPLKKGDFVGS